MSLDIVLNRLLTNIKTCVNNKPNVFLEAIPLSSFNPVDTFRKVTIKNNAILLPTLNKVFIYIFIGT